MDPFIEERISTASVGGIIASPTTFLKQNLSWQNVL